jgi:parvulin-like peptidyl-prolyl isomerase
LLRRMEDETIERKESILKRAILLVLVGLLAFSGACTKREDLVVAEIGDKKITVADVEAISETLDNKYLPETDDLDGKKQLLDHMLNKEIMALKATGAGYEKEEWFIKFWEQFKNPFLVAAMMDEKIRKPITVTDEEVEDYYERMHYEYTLSQILVTSEEEAWRIREKIMGGEDFAEMAKMYSIGPAASEGGLIGTNVVGRIHYWVEEALFDMEAGDVSEPLRTSSGWALLKVHQVRKIIPELEKSYAGKRVRAIKEKKGIEEYKARIEKEIELRFFPDAVEIAYNALPEDINFEDIISYKVTRENAPKLNIPDKNRDMIIAQYVDGVYYLKDFEQIYEGLALPERPRRQYGKESVVLAIHKRIFDQVLPVYAEQREKILEVPSVREALERKKEQFLVHRLYQDQIRDGVTVTERQVKEFYEENKDNMRTPEKREYIIILVKDDKTATEVMVRAKGGQDFVSLVKEFSEDQSAKESLGRTGLVEKGKFPEFDDVAFALQNVGDISDPFKTSRGWAVVKVETIEPGKLPSLEEAFKNIKKQLMEEKAELLLHEKLEKWRENYDVRINEPNLDKVELKRLKI